jgi:hypothetical protein
VKVDLEIRVQVLEKEFPETRTGEQIWIAPGESGSHLARDLASWQSRYSSFQSSVPPRWMIFNQLKAES